jgi:hypothetical protein
MGQQGPEIDSHMYGQLFFDKSAKTIQQRKKNLSNKYLQNKWIIHLGNGGVIEIFAYVVVKSLGTNKILLLDYNMGKQMTWG